MSGNEYGGRDSFAENRNPGSDDTGRESNRQRTTKNKNKSANDVSYSDRLIEARERGLPKVGLYQPIDTSRLKTLLVQRALEKTGPNKRIGSGLRRSRPYQGPTNKRIGSGLRRSRPYQGPTNTRPRECEVRDPYQLNYLNHSGFIHSFREKRRPNSAPPSRAGGPRQPSRSPTPPRNAYTPMQPVPVQYPQGTFTYENPGPYEDPYQFPKAREPVPKKVPTKQVKQPKQPPGKPKVVPKKGPKEPTPRPKNSPPSNQQRHDPEETNPQMWDPSPVIPIHANPYHATNPTLDYDPYQQTPFEMRPPQEVIPDPFPFETHPQLQNNPHQLPSTPPQVSTPHFTPRYEDDPRDFTPNPIYTYPLQDPSPPPPVRSPIDPIIPPQSKYVTPVQPKITPSIQPKTTTPATPRKSAPKPKSTPRVPLEIFAPPAARPTPKPKPSLPKKYPAKKPLVFHPKISYPSRTPPQDTPRSIYAPPSRQNAPYNPTTPPYSPPTPAPRTPPRREPRRELTPSPSPPPPPLSPPESRIPRARLQPPEREPYRKPPSPSIYDPPSVYDPPSRTPRPKSRHEPPKIRTPPRTRPPPPPTDDDYDDEFPDYGSKDRRPSPGGYRLPPVYQPQRSPEPQSQPIRRTYYPPTLGLEKERLHSMGTIMRSMAMYRHRGGAGTWSFRT